MQPQIVQSHHPDRCFWEMVDSDLRIVACTLDVLPQWEKEQFYRELPQADISSLTFFYVPAVDVVVLNKNHHDADIYEILVTKYLSCGIKKRGQIKSLIKPEVIGEAFALLDYIIEIRRTNDGKRTEVRDSGNPDRISG